MSQSTPHLEEVELLDLTDGVPTQALRVRAEVHLDACDRCREALVDFLLVRAFPARRACRAHACSSSSYRVKSSSPRTAKVKMEVLGANAFSPLGLQDEDVVSSSLPAVFTFQVPMLLPQTCPRMMTVVPRKSMASAESTSRSCSRRHMQVKSLVMGIMLVAGLMTGCGGGIEDTGFGSAPAGDERGEVAALACNDCSWLFVRCMSRQHVRSRAVVRGVPRAVRRDVLRPRPRVQRLHGQV